MCEMKAVLAVMGRKESSCVDRRFNIVAVSIVRDLVSEVGNIYVSQARCE